MSRRTTAVRAPPVVPSARLRPPVKARKTRVSNFFITLNTNQPAASGAQVARIHDDIQRVTRELWGSDANQDSMIRFLHPGGRPSDILNVEVDSEPEVGPLRGMIHAHILVRITHNTPGRGIHLRPDAMKRFYRTHATSPELKRLPYLRIMGFSDRDDVADYINKARHRAEREADIKKMESELEEVEK